MVMCPMYGKMGHWLEKRAEVRVKMDVCVCPVKRLPSPQSVLTGVRGGVRLLC